MPAPSKRPAPPARMADLLIAVKREMLAAGVELTRGAFEAAWATAWVAMVAERGWPHATEHRRQWRAAMLAAKPEFRAAFLGRETTFGQLIASLTLASRNMRVDLTPDDVPRVIIGAIQHGYSIVGENERDTVAA